MLCRMLLNQLLRGSEASIPRYSNEIKEKALAMIEIEGIAKTLEAMGISKQILNKWINAAVVEEPVVEIRPVPLIENESVVSSEPVPEPGAVSKPEPEPEPVAGSEAEPETVAKCEPELEPAAVSEPAQLTENPTITVQASTKVVLNHLIQ